MFVFVIRLDVVDFILYLLFCFVWYVATVCNLWCLTLCLAAAGWYLCCWFVFGLVLLFCLLVCVVGVGGFDRT